MEAQQIFDKVAVHLFTQGKRALSDAPPNEIGLCVYRGPEGTSCAAGCLITDFYYEKSMEGKTIGMIVDSYTLPSWFGDNLALISALQRVHDDKSAWRTTSIMMSALASVAVKAGLSSAAIEGLTLPHEASCAETTPVAQ